MSHRHLAAPQPGAVPTIIRSIHPQVRVGVAFVAAIVAASFVSAWAAWTFLVLMLVWGGYLLLMDGAEDDPAPAYSQLDGENSLPPVDRVAAQVMDALWEVHPKDDPADVREARVQSHAILIGSLREKYPDDIPIAEARFARRLAAFDALHGTTEPTKEQQR